jgi:iron complex transport system substrate-binding protein
LNGSQRKLFPGLLLAAVLIIGLLSGCASAGNQAAAPAGDTGNGTANAAPPATRTVKHLKGESTIPANAKRIAALDYRISDSLLALGIKPVASGSFVGSTDIPYMDGNPLKEAINLGDTPNLEAILAAQPDLIIGTDVQTIAYDSLSQIAPTVIVSVTPKDWQAALRELGQMLDRERQAADWIAQYTVKAEEAKKQMSGRVGPNETVMFLRVLKKEFRLYGERQLTGTLLYQDLGMKAPPQVSAIEGVNKVISMEMLPEINPDYILLDVGAIAQGGDKQGEALYNELLQSALWKNMKAVKNNHVYRVPDWFFRTDFPISRGKSLTVAIDALVHGKEALQK